LQRVHIARCVHVAQKSYNFLIRLKGDSLWDIRGKASNRGRYFFIGGPFVLRKAGTSHWYYCLDGGASADFKLKIFFWHGFFFRKSGKDGQAWRHQKRGVSRKQYDRVFRHPAKSLAPSLPLPLRERERFGLVWTYAEAAPRRLGTDYILPITKITQRSTNLSVAKTASLTGL
jgi:hypothetical protein